MFCMMIRFLLQQNHFYKYERDIMKSKLRAIDVI
jgi:hypothetical protein